MPMINKRFWGEPCAHETLGIDTNQLVLENFHKQIIYNQVRPTIDLCASDLCSFCHGIDCSGNNAYSTIGHDNLRYLKDIIHHHPKFYIFPHPQDYYNTKYEYGNTWTEWAHAINEALQEAFDSSLVYEGSFILPGMEDNRSAETLFMNPLNPGMISLPPGCVGQTGSRMPTHTTPRPTLTAPCNSICLMLPNIHIFTFNSPLATSTMHTSATAKSCTLTLPYSALSTEWTAPSK